MKPASVSWPGSSSTTAPGPARRRFEIAGRVQGVGFRPFLFRLARDQGCRGRIYNDSNGVVFDAEGAPARLAELPDLIRSQAPAGARIDRIETLSPGPVGFDDLRLVDSETRTSSGRAEAGAEAAPDLAPCADCLDEIQDPAGRRFGYAFTSCTACGPRFTILDALPYDRVRTGMRDFVLCDACYAEYTDPSDRRFHHEANCCPRCGPRLELRDGKGALLSGKNGSDDELLSGVADRIAGGEIVALKGVGGYQLLASARSAAAVARLREAKARPRKPFALMVPDLETARRFVSLSPVEEAVLTGPAVPILIASMRTEALEEYALDLIAPGSSLLGLMLPASPLHFLLARKTGSVVCTSGNRESEPIQIDDREARAALGAIADVFLVHDRPILRPADDSVVRVMADAPVTIRRGRGFAPNPLLLPADAPPLIPTLALGAHLKNAPAIGAGRRILLAQHVGDLDTRAAQNLSRRTADDLCRLSGIQPERYACDRHPDYASTREAERRTGDGEPLRIQHHIAHVYAVLVEYGILPDAVGDDAILGVAWDGTGYGADGSLWGGECFVLKGNEITRRASLREIGLPGGESAIRDPGRIALGMLEELLNVEPSLGNQVEAMPCVRERSRAERDVLREMLGRGLNAPVATGVGRLFDAFAALLGLVDQVTFEGEAALALELRAREYAASRSTGADFEPEPLPFSLEAGEVVRIDWRPALRRALDMIADGSGPGPVARAFHEGLARAIRAVAAHNNVRRVALGGGCFQNQLLLERTRTLLEADGCRVFSAREVPPGDGGLAVGQVVAANTNLGLRF